MKTTTLKKGIYGLWLSILLFPLVTTAQFTASIDLVYFQSQCAGNPVYLTAIPSDTSLYEYEWTCPNGVCPNLWNVNDFEASFFTNPIDPFTTEIYSVLITELATGDTVSASVAVTIWPNPVAGYGVSSQWGCEGTQVAIYGGGGPLAHGPYTYEWAYFPGTPVPMDSFMYTFGPAPYGYGPDLFVTNGYGCQAQNFYILWMHGHPTPQVSISANGPVSFCAGGNVELNAVATHPSHNIDPVTYQWKKYGNNLSNTGADLTVTTTGRYRCIATSDMGCSKTSNFIDVIRHPLPQVSITPSGPLGLCYNQPVVLEMVAPTAVFQQWKRYANDIGGATVDSLHVTRPGKYRVVVEDANGCKKGSAPVEVFAPPSNQVTVSGSLTICIGDSVTFTAASGYTYQWKRYGHDISGAISPSYTATTAGKYRVLVTNNLNCTVSSIAFEVVVINCPARISSNHFESENLTVYPNPLIDELYVSLTPEFDAHATIYIYDMTGRLILQELHSFESGNAIPISLPNMKPGTYLIKVESEDFSFRKVVLKQ